MRGWLSSTPRQPRYGLRGRLSTSRAMPRSSSTSLSGCWHGRRRWNISANPAATRCLRLEDHASDPIVTPRRLDADAEQCPNQPTPDARRRRQQSAGLATHGAERDREGSAEMRPHRAPNPHPARGGRSLVVGIFAVKQHRQMSRCVISSHLLA